MTVSTITGDYYGAVEVGDRPFVSILCHIPEDLPTCAFGLGSGFPWSSPVQVLNCRAS